MKTTLRSIIAAFALITAAFAAPTINTPKDVKAWVFQADLGTCQIETGRGNPCAPHVTVFILPHANAAAIYRVTIQYHNLTGNQEPLTVVKQVAAVDTTPTVTILLSSAVIDVVTVEIAQ